MIRSWHFISINIMKQRLSSQGNSVSRLSERSQPAKFCSLKKLPNLSARNKPSLKQQQLKGDNGVKLSNSYYNDRENIYIKRSRSLS